VQQSGIGAVVQRLLVRSHAAGAHTLPNAQSSVRTQHSAIGVVAQVPPGPLHVVVVHTSPSSGQSPSVLQQPAIGAWAHPLASAQVSAVQASPSSHTSGAPGVPTVPAQISAPLQAAPSLHERPSPIP
jgi:hypothetical protein